MATRNPDPNADFVMDVYLKNGQTFIGKDIPVRPMGETENVISFWNDDELYIISMNEVEKVILREEKQS